MKMYMPTEAYPNCKQFRCIAENDDVGVCGSTDRATKHKVQAMSDWPNGIISTAPVSLTVG